MEMQIEMPITQEMERKPDAFMVLVDKLKGLPPESMGLVLDSYERFLKIQAKQAYDAAMGELKKNIPAIVKNKLADMNGKYSYKYATLEDICDKLDPVLLGHGFGYRWTTHPSDKGVVIGCVLTHLQGHSEETLMPVAPHDNSGGKNPIQAIGSTLSYLQRYSLLMALGIAPRNVDNDAKTVEEKGGELPKLDEWLQTIKDAASFEELQQKYTEAYKAASAAKDQKAKDAIIFCKNTRKEQIRKAGAR